jgi:uncharacterized protein (TIRG00374 family)
MVLGQKAIWVVLKAIVSLVLLVAAFSTADPAKAMLAITEISAPAWLLGALLVSLQIPLLASRWWIILQNSGLALSYPAALRFTYIGFFFNQALPSSVGGDVMRAYLVFRKGIAFSHALASVLLERATGLFIIALFPLLLLAEDTTSLQAGLSHQNLAATVFLLACSGLLALGALKFVTARLKQAGRLVNMLDVLGSQFLGLLKSARAMSAVFILGLLSALAGLSAFEAAVLSLGLELSYLQVLGISALAIIASVIPLSISGWGVRENVIVWLLLPLGVPAEKALGLSVWFGLVTLAASIPGSILWLRSR